MLKDSYPYFIFDGNADEAIRFYAEILEAQVLDTSKFKDMPNSPEDPPIPEEASERIMNATIQLPNGSYIMFSDIFPGMSYNVGNNLSLTLVYDDPAETRAVFDKLKEGGKIEMDLQETFWSPLYGNLFDKYGIQWQISTLGAEDSL
ncbi:VOC family protein [Desemzia sp. RIT804]|uniref:VOC family protein n=1 Tax=Desemzia sp. RIT 804 TaxID=2810209 RepID=UPI00194DB7EA|nr:VOC family protein [Desemzia sp. RIT 804]MBM6615142.1 VOC family protein [Desemzia sp. RIT 804]